MSESRSRTSLYYADDKDVHDILTSAKQKFTTSKLTELALRRGIVLSADDDRQNLIDYISLLSFGWNDITHMMDLLDSHGRSEKQRSYVIESKVNADKLIAASNAVKESRGPHDEVYRVFRAGSSVHVHVEYSAFDESKTRLRQRVDRDFTIELEVNNGRVQLRHPDNERAQQIAGEICAAIGTVTNSKPPEVHEISLSGIRNPQLRSRFFMELFSGLAGFKVHDVTTINSANSTAYSDDDSSYDEESESDKILRAVIKRVSLDGSQVLVSREFSDLHSRGHYIHRVVWTANEQSGKGVRVEFEASFGDVKNATGFRYAVRNVFERNNKTGELRKTPTHPSDQQRIQYSRLMEASAESALDTVVKAAESEIKAAERKK